MSTEIHPVDQILPTPRLLALGLQHVLVMYAGAVAVPLIIGRALKLPPEDVAFLISADLFACGLATLVQCIGFPGVGIRLPVMMGVTFASVGPMLSMAAAPDIGLLGIYGSVIAAGIFGILAAPFISRLLPLFPPVVTGTIILIQDADSEYDVGDYDIVLGPLLQLSTTFVLGSRHMGGRTWKIEVPSYLDDQGKEKEATDCPGGIDFTPPVSERTIAVAAAVAATMNKSEPVPTAPPDPSRWLAAGRGRLRR